MSKYDSEYGISFNRKTCRMEAVRYTHVTDQHLIGYAVTLTSNGRLRASKTKKRHHKHCTDVSRQEVVRFLKNQG